MKIQIIQLTLAFTLMCISQSTAQKFRSTESDWELTIIKLERTDGKIPVMKVTARLKAVGKGPIAFSQNQFSSRIHSKDTKLWYTGDVIFGGIYPKIFTVHPRRSVKFTFTVGPERFGKKLPWYELPTGDYEFSISIGSGKERKFDYQWLGTGYTNPWKFTHKKKPNKSKHPTVNRP